VHDCQEVDLDAYSRFTNTLRRTLEALGIRRVPREAGPVTIKDYLGAKAANDEHHPLGRRHLLLKKRRADPRSSINQ
jgi:hypothetical protein